MSAGTECIAQKHAQRMQTPAIDQLTKPVNVVYASPCCGDADIDNELFQPGLSVKG